MSEKDAIARYTELRERENLPVCVPASLQFLLPDHLKVPQSLFEQAIAEGGLFPTKAMERLQADNLITYAVYSVTQEESDSYFADHIKYILGEETTLGVGFSLESEADYYHFVTVKGPLLGNNHVRIFDTSHRTPVYWTNLDRLISQSMLCSRYGRHNVWFVYPGSKE